MEFTEYSQASHRNRKFLYTALSVILVIYSVVALGIALSGYHWTLDVLIGYLLIANIVAMYRTATLEPGFLPVRSVPSFDLTPVLLKGNISVVPDVLSSTRIISFTDDNGRNDSYVQKYCLSCNIFRPDRASHCADCGYCVLSKDHHCLWLNNCIGRNNHALFLLFIITLSLLSLYGTLSLRTLSEIYRGSKLAYVLKGASFGMGAVTGVLLLFEGYHLFITLFDVPSREFISRRGAVVFDLNVRRILQRLSTIKPIILQTKAAI